MRAATASAEEATVAVWGLAVRLFHWSLVASFATAWLTADGPRDLHEWAGYAAAALLAFRLVHGVVGPRHARFRDFVRGPSATLAYLGAMRRGEERRHLGHNPAGGAMIVALLALLAVTATTGWMYTLDAFWGEEWVEELHEVAATLMLALVVLHVGGVLFSSLRHHENLVRAMIVGTKRAPERDDVV